MIYCIHPWNRLQLHAVWFESLVPDSPGRMCLNPLIPRCYPHSEGSWSCPKYAQDSTSQNTGLSFSDKALIWNHHESWVTTNGKTPFGPFHLKDTSEVYAATQWLVRCFVQQAEVGTLEQQKWQLGLCQSGPGEHRGLASLMGWFSSSIGGSM